MSKLIFNKSSIDVDYPNCRPTLDLDFTQEKLDPRITFTRGSTGTRVNKFRQIETIQANQPRFDYDPISGECRGLLIEEGRTNLLTYSDDFSNASWVRNNQNINTNVITAPDGTLTADKLITINASSAHHLYKVPSLSSNTYTLSIFAKAAEQNLMRLGIDDGILSRNTTFNLTNGSISSSANVTSSTITPYPNSWYRCSITVTTNIINVVFNTPYPNAGDGTSGIYIWGAQLEIGAFATSYIPTTASTVTRSADNVSMTGTNFSSWYNQSAGSIISSCISRRPTNDGNGADFAITNSTYTSRIVGWFNNAAGPYISVIANNNAVYLPNINVPSGVTNISIKKAISLSDKNMRVSINGKLITGDAGNTGVQDYLPNDFDRLFIGYEGIFAGYLHGTISRLTYYPRALQQNQLQFLTS
jgi:hypothetical protein